MDKMQYNNVIAYTLKHERLEQTRDSLTTARAILNNMGVALPQGDIETVFKTIRTMIIWDGSLAPCRKRRKLQTVARRLLASIEIE